MGTLNHSSLFPMFSTDTSKQQCNNNAIDIMITLFIFSHLFDALFNLDINSCMGAGPQGRAGEEQHLAEAEKQSLPEAEEELVVLVGCFWTAGCTCRLCRT